nr:hypothetical protein GCM10017544_20150 [Microbacterium imperiale]
MGPKPVPVEKSIRRRVATVTGPAARGCEVTTPPGRGVDAERRYSPHRGTQALRAPAVVTVLGDQFRDHHGGVLAAPQSRPMRRKKSLPAPLAAAVARPGGHVISGELPRPTESVRARTEEV